MNMRLIFFAFFDRTLLHIEVFHRGEALHRLRCQIAVWHRMADYNGRQSVSPQFRGDEARYRTLTASGPHRTDRDNRDS